MSEQTYRMIRTDTGTGRVYTVAGLTEFEARQKIAWCCTDNLGWERREARELAGSAELGLAVFAEGYQFQFVEEVES